MRYFKMLLWVFFVVAPKIVLGQTVIVSHDLHNVFTSSSIREYYADIDLYNNKKLKPVVARTHSINGRFHNYFSITDYFIVRCTVDSVLDIKRCGFKSLKLLDCKFNYRVIIDSSRFIQDVSFAGSKIDAEVSITNCKFAGRPSKLSFCKAILGKNFALSVIDIAPKILDFSYCTIEGETLEIGSLLPKNHFVISSDEKVQLDLRGVDVSKIEMDFTGFELCKNDGENDVAENELTTVYEGLLKNFRDRGQMVNASKLDIEYRLYRASKHGLLSSTFAQISNLWWAFGYAKGRIFFWTIIFLCVFTFITYLLLEFLQQNIYPLEVIKKKEESTNSYNHPYSPKFRKLWYSFVYTGTIFFGLTLKIDHFKFDPRPRNVIGTFYLLFMYVLGILCLAYMANFVIQQ